MPAGDLAVALKPMDLSSLRHAIESQAFVDEKTHVTRLLRRVEHSAELRHAARERAKGYVEHMRSHAGVGVEAFLNEYRLDTREGVLIMCLAEALLRIPDEKTANRLIRDKLVDTEWQRYIGQSESFLVNASAWGLMLTGKIVQFDEEDDAFAGLRSLVRKTGEPVIRKALKQAMQWMGSQFILGRTIEEGLKQAQREEKRGYLYSYDILGEGARTDSYAEDYARRYRDAIIQIGSHAPEGKDIFQRPSISIKLSALHARYDGQQHARVTEELLPRLKELMLCAKEHNIMAAIDAEEAHRLDISLDVFESLARDADLDDWNGLSLVVQAYQKRANAVIDWLAEIAQMTDRQIPVRLVKGAYWDTEIKRAQQLGLQDYPVFTHKYATDISYIACARQMLRHDDVFYPQFATHNALTVASILEMAAPGQRYEFQRLHGMGGALYDYLLADDAFAVPCRIYAPIGVHKDLLAYLVRRLLENGANSSFINQLGDKAISSDQIIADPVELARRWLEEEEDDHALPLPSQIYGANRMNSSGMDLPYHGEQQRLYAGITEFANHRWQANSLVNGKAVKGDAHSSVNPADLNDEVGKAVHATAQQATDAMDSAASAFRAWEATPAAMRASILKQAADLLEGHRYEAIALAVREAGKTLQDAIDEVREAVDFCRYYAVEGERRFGEPLPLPGPTGEDNQLSLHGRGVFVCISPWNFPLAIFMGQVSAALMAGNCVVAKPAEQTPLIAHFAVTLLHEAGVPPEVLQLVLGPGSEIGPVLLDHPALAGVAFTGSTATARRIQQQLAAKDGPIIPLIAETGGQNAMIVDSSALPEQVSDDVIHSAFGSAGQRCSALRVLFVQQDVADTILDMLTGAMEELTIGKPWEINTDIGPVIDEAAKSSLDQHKQAMHKRAKALYEMPLSASLAEQGHFVTPAAFEIEGIDWLDKEHFGPILHVVRYKADKLEAAVDAINATGYGLTLGIHSRIDDTVDRIIRRAHVGNIYVNRGMTGAVVGVQPFGGEGLSGTGPKAGGPHYLLRFATERTTTTNTAAIGGNLELFT